MNILCIYSVEDYVCEEKPLASPLDIPFGISYVASALKEEGFRPKILVLTPQADYRTILRQRILKDKPTLFCLTAVTSQYEYILKIAAAIKDLAPESFVAVGGHYVTLNPSSAIEETVFDAVCIGEGEEAIVKYANQIVSGGNPFGINNMWIRNRQNGSIEKNPQNEFLRDLDRLSYIDRTMWEEWINEAGTFVSVLAGRGCPNKCTYCSNHALAKISNGKYVRFRSPENIIGEIKTIQRGNSRVKRIFLEVETIGANLKYAEDLIEALYRFNQELSEPLSYGINLAVSPKIAQNSKLLERLKKANFKFVTIGLESGSERVRKEILRRPKYSNEDIFSFCQLLRKYGIEIHMQVMVGIPGETRKEFKQTIACVRECNPELASLSIFYPYPGTDLHRTAIELGIFSDSIIRSDHERTKATLDLPDFSRSEIQFEYYMFYLNVYKGVRPLLKVIAMTVRNYVYSHPKMNAFYKRMTSMPVFIPLKKKLSMFS